MKWLLSYGAILDSSKPHSPISILAPAFMLIPPLSFTQLSRQKTICFLGAGLVSCWLREQAQFVEGSNKHWRWQEHATGSREMKMGAGCPFMDSLQLELCANAKQWWFHYCPYLRPPSLFLALNLAMEQLLRELTQLAGLGNNYSFLWLSWFSAVSSQMNRTALWPHSHKMQHKESNVHGKQGQQIAHR